MYIVFDIETGANSRVAEFTPEFDVSEVKIGNLVDPAKIEAKLKQAKAIHYKTFEEGAALSPITGEILAIGYCNDKGEVTIDYQDYSSLLAITEKDIIEKFWNTVIKARENMQDLVGWKNKTFDLPYIIQRSWINGIEPYPLYDTDYGVRWKSWIIDAMEFWQINIYKKFGEQVKSDLDTISKLFGLPGKIMKGKDFSKVFKTDKEKALKYLTGDLTNTKEIFERLRKRRLWPSNLEKDADFILDDFFKKQ